ncbi:hypothetical protein ACFGVR_01845 [Mucilaginibacter sp. AW1-3]
MKNQLFAILLTLFTTLCYAQNPNITKLENNNYKVRILPANFRYERMSQSGDLPDNARYWAACLSMIINYNGLSVSQADAATLGTGVLNAATPNSWGRAAHIFCDELTLDEDALFDQLSANRPLIVTLRSADGEGRANIIAAMTYTIKFNSQGEQTGITPTTVTLVDPGTSSQSQRVVNWTDFIISVNTLYSVKISFK